jgi:hypothetical protein
VALLRGDGIRGLLVPVKRVEFQQRLGGRPLDDIVFRGEGPRTDISVDYQSKRNLPPTSGNSDFRAVIVACIETLRADPEGVSNRHHRLGLAASRPAVQLEQLDRVCEIARANHNPASFQAVLVPGTTNSDVRDRYAHLKETVRASLEQIDGHAAEENDVDHVTWQIASALEIWIADVEGDGRDARLAIDRLADHTGDRLGADQLFNTLIMLAETWGPSSGTVDLGMLRAELERRGLALEESPFDGGAFRAAQASTDRMLANPDARMAGQLHLPRQALRLKISQSAVSDPVTLVTGKAGSGKSALLRMAAVDLRNAGTVVVGVTLAHGMTAGDLESVIGARLGDALAGAPTGMTRVLIVDGAEQALSDGSQVLGHVLDSLPHPETNPAWNLVITARDEAAVAVESIVADRLGGEPSIVPVGDLSDEEVTEVLAAFPHLVGIARHPRPANLLLRRPFLVSLLARHAPDALVDRLLGEEDVIDLLVDRVIRRGGGAFPGRGTPAARSDVFLALADAQIAGQIPARVEGSDGEAVDGLRIDDIITLDRLSYRFAHDVLADYAIATRLLESGGEDVLRTAPEPRRLLRGARLWMQRCLADVAHDSPATISCFERLLALATEMADTDGPRWLTLPYEALLHAGSSPELLSALEGRLVADDGHHLAVLLDTSRRLGRKYS